MKLKVVLEPSEEGGYTVYVPSLYPGVSVKGILKRTPLTILKKQLSFTWNQLRTISSYLRILK